MDLLATIGSIFGVLAFFIGCLLLDEVKKLRKEISELKKRFPDP